MYKKVKRITNIKLRRQGENQEKTVAGIDGILQIAKTLFSLWSLVKEMHTETKAQAWRRAKLLHPTIT